MGASCNAGSPAGARRRSSTRSSTPGTLRAMQAALEDVAVEDSVGRYIVSLTSATREHPSVLVGASPRGSLALLLLARAGRGARRPGLRGAGGRQGRRGARAGSSDHAAPGDVAAPGRLGQRGGQQVLHEVPAPASAAMPQYTASHHTASHPPAPYSESQYSASQYSAGDGSGVGEAGPVVPPARRA